MTTRVGPVRTCVGCRTRAAASDLLRIAVAAPATAGEPGVTLVVDPRGGMPGRGAHLHPDADCLALAERRRAFGRALRTDHPLDVTPVREWVEHRAPQVHRPQSPRGRTTTMSAR